MIMQINLLKTDMFGGGYGGERNCVCHRSYLLIYGIFHEINYEHSYVGYDN